LTVPEDACEGPQTIHIRTPSSLPGSVRHTSGSRSIAQRS